jgi:hypothetical protein
MTARRLKRAVPAAAAALISASLCSLLFADELVRATTTRTTPAPFDLPPGVEIRLAPRLTRIIGAPSGGASAVTVGRTILVPHMRVLAAAQEARATMRMSGDTLILSRPLWDQVMSHEVVHVAQRERFGRWYLPIYVYWYIRRGYAAHPFEREAAGRLNSLQPPLQRPNSLFHSR